MRAAPLVGLIMGSRSDWETMRHAAETLEARPQPGKAQLAVRKWFSSEFSTTVIWNCRGRQRIAAAESTFIAIQRSSKLFVE